MPSTYQSIVLNVPIDTVWNTVKNFHDFSWAPDVITNCVAEGDKKGTEPGAKRILNDAFYETLIECNEENHLVRYSIDDGPTPVSKDDVKNYIGRLQLLPVTDSNTTFVEWSSDWKSSSDEAIEFCHGIYVALLSSLANKFT